MGCGPGKRQWVPVLNPVLDSFRNVIFDITPGDEAGRFEVNAKFLGVDMERFQLHYQVRDIPMSPPDTRWALVASLKMEGWPGFPGPWTVSTLFPIQSTLSVPEDESDGLCSPSLPRALTQTPQPGDRRVEWAGSGRAD